MRGFDYALSGYKYVPQTLLQIDQTSGAIGASAPTGYVIGPNSAGTEILQFGQTYNWASTGNIAKGLGFGWWFDNTKVSSEEVYLMNLMLSAKVGSDMQLDIVLQNVGAITNDEAAQPSAGDLHKVVLDSVSSRDLAVSYCANLIIEWPTSADENFNFFGFELRKTNALTDLHMRGMLLELQGNDPVMVNQGTP